MYKENRIVSYGVIAIFVITFNLISVFGLKTLLLYDQFRYTFAIENYFPWYIARENFFRPFILFVLYKLMVLSPALARAVQLTVFMVPLSWVLFYLYRNIFGLPLIISIAAAILPNILPGQELIPAFIDGSYTVQGLLATIVAFCFGFRYLQSEDSKGKFYWLAVIAYIFSVEMMVHAIFLVVPFVFAFLQYKKSDKKHLYLIFSFLSIAIIKMIWIITHPIATNTPTNLSVGEIIDRVKGYIYFTSPIGSIFENFWPKFWIGFLLIYGSVIFLGFVFYLIKNDKLITRNIYFQHLSQRRFYVYLYGFAFLWLIASITPFIGFSPYYSSRYAHISSFGFILLIVISLYSILHRLTFKRNKIIIIFFIFFICFSGTQRHKQLRGYFSTYNLHHRIIVKNLSNYEFPVNSQIVIVGNIGTFTGGYWHWSSGYLKYATKRKDINGIFPYEYNYYNPFDKKERSFFTKMRGLDIDLPLFLFRAVPSNEANFIQLQYALQWRGETKHAEWVIYKLDKERGVSSCFLEGKGWIEYQKAIEALENKGIQKLDVLWGGNPSSAEKMRLGL